MADGLTSDDWQRFLDNIFRFVEERRRNRASGGPVSTTVPAGGSGSNMPPPQGPPVLRPARPGRTYYSIFRTFPGFPVPPPEIRRPLTYQGATDANEWTQLDPTGYWTTHDSAFGAFDAYDIDSGDFKRGFDSWVEDFYQEHGRWPGTTDVFPETRDGYPVANGMLASYVLRSAIRTDALPGSFWVVDDDGSEHYVVNTVERGPMPVEASEWDFWADIGPPQTLATQLSARGQAGAVMANRITSGDFISAPRIPKAVLPEILNMNVVSTGGGGGGGRGVVFDRDRVIETIRESWRSLLLEEPANIGALADQYISQATSFAYQGGSLDLRTWVLNKARENPKYQVLYARKPESVGEAEYLGSYFNIASQAGLRADTVTAQATRGAQYNLNPAAFGESLEQTREFRAQNQGLFSRRFAQTLAGLGPMMRG